MFITESLVVAILVLKFVISGGFIFAVRCAIQLYRNQWYKGNSRIHKFEGLLYLEPIQRQRVVNNDLENKLQSNISMRTLSEPQDNVPARKRCLFNGGEQNCNLLTFGQELNMCEQQAALATCPFYIYYRTYHFYLNSTKRQMYNISISFSPCCGSKNQCRNALIAVSVLLAASLIVIIGLSIAYAEKDCDEEPTTLPPEPDCTHPTDGPPPGPPANPGGPFNKAAVAFDDVRCSEIGARILKRNGSAVDAAIAGMFCIGVINMHSAGIGGGAVMVVYSNASKTAEYFNFREKAPKNASQNMFEMNSTASKIGENFFHSLTLFNVDSTTSFNGDSTTSFNVDSTTLLFNVTAQHCSMGTAQHRSMWTAQHCCSM